jgi:CRP-like cAMP-binding protein
MSTTPASLRSIPLFTGITDEHLLQLSSVFEHTKAAVGDVLFRAGDVPTHFLLLVDGEVTLTHEGEPRFQLLPVAPIGELGAITGLPRRTTATVSAPSEVWRVEVSRLLQFFEAHGDVAFPFYHNLLGIVADKVGRDERRLDDMRGNLVRTQKAMKQLRETVLEAAETAISTPTIEQLDELIEHNRRGHYRVAPKHALSTSVRLDDGRVIPVDEMSDGHLHLAADAGLAAGQALACVLMLPGRELPISGKVEKNGAGLTLALDLLIDDYAKALGEHLTRVQMLDFVV